MPITQMQNKAQKHCAILSRMDNAWMQYLSTKGAVRYLLLFFTFSTVTFQDKEKSCCFPRFFYNQLVRTFRPMLRTTSSRQNSLSKTNLIGKIAKNDWNKIFIQALHCDCGIMHPGQLRAMVVFLPLPLTGPLHIFNFVTFGLCGMKLKKYPLKCKTKLSEKYDVGFDCWKRKTWLRYNCAHLRLTSKKTRTNFVQNGPRHWNLIPDKKWYDQFFLYCHTISLLYLRRMYFIFL